MLRRTGVGIGGMIGSKIDEDGTGGNPVPLQLPPHCLSISVNTQEIVIQGSNNSIQFETNNIGTNRMNLLFASTFSNRAGKDLVNLVNMVNVVNMVIIKRKELALFR